MSKGLQDCRAFSCRHSAFWLPARCSLLNAGQVAAWWLPTPKAFPRDQHAGFASQGTNASCCTSALGHVAAFTRAPMHKVSRQHFPNTTGIRQVVPTPESGLLLGDKNLKSPVLNQLHTCITNSLTWGHFYWRSKTSQGGFGQVGAASSSAKSCQGPG